MSERIVHNILSDCDVEVSKSGENIRLRIREKDPDLIVPTDLEFEGDVNVLYAIFDNIAEILDRIRHLEENKEN